MLSFDSLLFGVILVSGLLFGYYAVARRDAEPERRKVIGFWREIFTLAVAVLTLRLFYLVFPSMPPDHFFLALAVIAAGVYIFYAINRRGETGERRKIVYLCRDIFLCLLAVFIFRGFFFDWFRIPSNSMQPTLQIGDVVLIDKNIYGYRLPVMGTRLSRGEPPQRGDIVVFRKPREDIFYIKRILGLPGDVIRYGDDKSLTINGEPVAHEIEETPPELNITLLRERLEGGWHHILINRRPGLLYQSPAPDHCRLTQTEIGYRLQCEVPAGRYFVLGDNRDHSNDSRAWGFVPQENIVGPAHYVLFNYHGFNNFFHPLRLRAE